MKPVATKTGMVRFGAAMLLSALAWLAGSSAAEAGVNVWTPVGPDGTEVTVLAIDPADPSTLYASTPVGVYKSADAGGSWSRILANTHARALVFDPQAPATLYAGTEKVSQIGPDAIGAGVLKSTDGGRTWRGINTGLPANSNNDVASVRSLAIDPSTPTTLHAVVDYRYFRSTDGGGSWTSISAGLTGTAVIALAIDPRTPTILYAATGRGVSKSTDGGASWVAANNGLPATSFSFLKVDPVTPATLYAGIYKDARDAAGAVLFKSTDGGAGWVTIGNGLPDAASPWYVSDLVIEPATPTTIYAALSSRFSVGSGGIFKSTDGGSNWIASDTGLPGRFVAALAIDPRTPSTLYAGTFGDGVFKSADGGGGWRAVNTGLPKTSTGCLVIDPRTPTTHYAVTSVRLGSANASTLHKSVDAGANWSVVGPISGCPRLDPQTPATMYLTGSHGVFKSTDGGVTWRHFNIGLDPSYRSGVANLTIDPRTPTTLYASAWRYSEWSMADRFSEGVFKSTDGGESWRRLGVSSGFCSGCDHWTVKSIAIDPQAPTTIYVANNLYVTRITEGGGAWGCGNLNLYFYSVGQLAIDPGTPSTLYVSTTDGVLKSTDGCRTWSAVIDGLPYRPYQYDASRRWYSVSTPAIDPVTPANLYVSAYQDGIFKSTDGGGSWNPLGPPPPAHFSSVDIDPVNPAILYVPTTTGVFTLEQRANRRPLAEAGTDRTVECAGSVGTEVTLDAGGSSDPDGDPLTYAWTGPFGAVEGPRPTVTLPLGVSTISIVVSDGELESDPAVIDVEVRDTVAPTLEVAATPALLWPPDGRMVGVALQVAAGDRCDSAPAIVLLDAQSSEPEDATRTGAPPIDADSGTDDRSVFLRAERSADGTGRIYTITYRATDASGNAATTAAAVLVPHDQRR